MAVRDELLRQRQEVDALPANVRAFLFTAGASRAVGPADYATVLRIARRLGPLSDAELEDYRAKVNARTDKWAEFEESIERYLRQRATRADVAADLAAASTALYGMEALYALYREWKRSRGMSDLVPGTDEFGVRDPNKRYFEQAEARIDADFRAALKANGIGSPEEFERLIADFLAAFERGTVQIGLDLLARYDHVLYAEQEGFEAAGAADRLAAAVAGTPARQLYAEAEDKAQGARGIQPDPELHRFFPGEYELKRRLEAGAGQAQASADALVIAAAARSPVISAADFDRAALARAAPGQALGLIRAYIAEHRQSIATTRAHLLDDRDFVYHLPPLLEVSLRLQEIRPGSVYGQIVADHVADRRGRELALKIALAVLAVAITLATAGTGTVAVLGAAAVFGLGAWQAVDAYREYAQGHAAYEARLLADDPAFGWVIVAAVGAGLDLAGVAAAIRPAKAAIVAFNEGGDVAKLASALEVARIEAKLSRNLIAGAEIEAGYRAAVTGLAGTAMRLNMVIGGLEGFGQLVRLVYHAARRGIVSLERFVLELRASRLLAEGELSAEQLVRLRTAFGRASSAARRLEATGRELGMTDRQIAAAVESWAASPERTLAEVEQEMRALAQEAGVVSRRLQRGWLRFRLDAPPSMWRALDTMPAGYAVYLVRDAAERVIYVGITGRTGWQRWAEHLADKGGEWLGQASRFEFVAVGLDTEKLALALEDDLMRQLAPRFNTQWTYLERFGTPPAAVDIPATNTGITLDLVHE